MGRDAAECLLVSRLDGRTVVGLLIIGELEQWVVGTPVAEFASLRILLRYFYCLKSCHLESVSIMLVSRHCV